jgi:hypothetical protein
MSRISRAALGSVMALLSVLLIQPTALADLSVDPIDALIDRDGSNSDQNGGSSASSYGHVIDLDVGGSDILDVGHSSASSSSSDGSDADATVLGVAGQELAGAHAEDGETDETGLLLELCATTGGLACLGLIYGYATAGDGSSSSDTAILDACLGGDDGERRSTESCGGLLWLSIFDSHADASSDEDGASASESSNGVSACVGGHDDDGSCTIIGARVLHSESSASSDGESEGESYIAGIEQGGDETTIGSDEVHVDVPSDCPEDSSVVCVALNEGGAEAGKAQQTLAGVEVLPSEDGAAGEGKAFDGGASASPQEPRDVSAGDPSDGGDPAGRAPGVHAAPGAELPFTGTAMLMWLVLGLAILALGASVVVAADRSRSWQRPPGKAG